MVDLCVLWSKSDKLKWNSLADKVEWTTYDVDQGEWWDDLAWCVDHKKEWKVEDLIDSVEEDMKNKVSVNELFLKYSK